MILPDKSLDDAMGDMYDAVVLPGGGPGAQALAASHKVKSVLESHDGAGKIIAAICAAPTALQAHGIGKGNNVTCRGPGTAVGFALKIVNILVGEDKAIKIG